MKIIIFGASGSGTTMLASELAPVIGYRHLDSDEYYWLKTAHPFTEKQHPDRRNSAFLEDLGKQDNVLVSGPVFGWDDRFMKIFDLAVFLWIPSEIRLNRLRTREQERYGDLLITDQHYKTKCEEFLNWAAGYDDPNFKSRSLALHNRWINQLQIPILRIEGDTSVALRIELLMDKIRETEQLG
ncbi:hypothetical protein SAMN04487995_2574 [Dyadobacter koreensis]|uniref:Adenylate kinase n=1 Tax=Dyadobacter koreensis TaxID=408657 RepID=A0A1H6URX0_9BACT|nr:hypothetical protein [Dyadobacter koreensis]SEI92467.1 hypothetical protein SAMN04487995_2574 [Dyadobacter koreensis]